MGEKRPKECSQSSALPPSFAPPLLQHFPRSDATQHQNFRSELLIERLFNEFRQSAARDARLAQVPMDVVVAGIGRNGHPCATHQAMQLIRGEGERQQRAMNATMDVPQPPAFASRKRRRQAQAIGSLVNHTRIPLPLSCAWSEASILLQNLQRGFPDGCIQLRFATLLFWSLYVADPLSRVDG